jgi:hypothetical protein
MIINSAPDNIAVLGNVSEIGEFKIKNSAKAFAILSSGLYANKIRAIIRELSCNAVDSHIAAGKKDVPFDLHLPTTFEPYFAIRDYGTGLSHEQVINIYTTYFESTKTNSNEFIGALGLGSKSPFSYTDNFTVTAIFNGIKGIYSAFINEYGVPSVARMADAETDEPDGVEVKFAVDIRSDYDKFRSETSEVLAYFPIKPNMTGASCTIRQLKYLEVDVVKGINVIDYDNYYGYDYNSIAVMGNIPYPIDVPNIDSNLGTLAVHLKKGIEIRFDIGELDFQASREGLSYTKETINAIRKKLQVLQDKLDGLLIIEANAIVNLWERGNFLKKKYSIGLWQNSIKNYIRSNNALNSILDANSYGVDFKSVKFTEKKLESEYNIKISGFCPPTYHGDRVTPLKMSKEYDHTLREYIELWSLNISKNINFVKYDKFRGGLEHAKYHYKESVNASGVRGVTTCVYILSPVKSDNPALFDKFFEDIYNPPKSCIIAGSDMIEKPRESREKNTYIVTAMKLTTTSAYRNKNYVWEPVQDIKTLDKSKNYYYIPVKGYTPIHHDNYPLTDIKELLEDIKSCGMSTLSNVGTIYGIRKADIDEVKTMKNWINIQDHLVSAITSVDVESLIGSYAKKTLSSNLFNFGESVAKIVNNADSDYVKFMAKCKNATGSMDTHSLSKLCKIYGGNVTTDTFMQKITTQIKDFTTKYPLLEHIDYKAKHQFVAEYINMIDN